MEYVRIIIKLDPDNELNREILIATLADAGYESFEETEEIVEAYIPSALYAENPINSDLLFKGKPFHITYSVESIPDQNWNEIWEKNYFKPLLIDNRCLIRAPFHNDFSKAEYEIIIEPRMAFGTGYHETTYLMVSEILELDLEGKKVLDMGCGTGILGILAAMKGAGSITCIDIDEWAYQNCIENVHYNHVPNIEVKLGGAELINGYQFDVILANIHRNILLNDMNYYRDSLFKGGYLIMSGFYREELTTIQNKSLNLGLKFVDFDEKNGWVAAKFILE